MGFWKPRKDMEMIDNRPQIAGADGRSRCQTADGRLQMADGRRQIAGGRVKLNLKSKI